MAEDPRGSVVPPSEPTPTAARWAAATLSLIAAAVAGWFGYGAGLQMGGWGLALVMAVNAAVIAALLAGSVVRRAGAWLLRRARD